MEVDRLRRVQIMAGTESRISDHDLLELRSCALAWLRQAMELVLAAERKGRGRCEPLAFVGAVGQMLEEWRRGSGRTLAEIFDVIGRALAAPNEWVPGIDHAGQRGNPDDVERFAQCVREVAKHQRLRLDVECSGGAVWVRSPLDRLRATAGRY